jgi:hypothetical protein
MTTTEPTGAQILAVPMQRNDADADTIGDYLVALLRKVWEDGDGFSGKRPFGNSGWEFDLYKALLVAGYVGGELDDEGYLDNVDVISAQALVAHAIDSLDPSFPYTETP